MPPPTWTVGQVLASADVNSWFVPLVGIKTSDTSRSNTVAQTNDPDLTVTLAANATYEFRMWLNYEGGTQGSSDLKMGMAVPASATARTSCTYVNNSGGATVEVYYASGGTALALGTNGAGNIRGFRMVGTVVTAGTSGSLVLSWAQNTSSATATIIHTGSILKAWRVS